MIIAYLHCSGEEHVLLDQCPHSAREKVDAQAGSALQTDSYPLLPDELPLTSGGITKQIFRKKVGQMEQATAK